MKLVRRPAWWQEQRCIHNVDAPMLVLFPEIKKKEVFLLFFNFTKRFQTTEKDFASMFQPSLFLRFIVVFFLFVFPSRHYPTHPQGKESSQSVNFLMPQEPTFSREESKWVTSLFWPRYKFYPRLPPPPPILFSELNDQLHSVRP